MESFTDEKNAFTINYGVYFSFRGNLDIRKLSSGLYRAESCYDIFTSQNAYSTGQAPISTGYIVSAICKGFPNLKDLYDVLKRKYPTAIDC